MGLFSSSDPEDEPNEPDVDGLFPDDRPRWVTVKREMAREESYTEHQATLTFADGEERELTFDDVTRGESGVTFKDYVGVDVKTVSGDQWTSFESEAWLFVPYSAMKSMETTDRVQRSMEYTAWETTTVRKEDVQEDDEVITE